MSMVGNIGLGSSDEATSFRLEERTLRMTDHSVSPSRTRSCLMGAAVFSVPVAASYTCTMKVHLVAHWPSEDILPTREEFDTARLAIRRYRQLVRFGMSAVGIFAIEGGERSRISPTRLLKLAVAERRLPRRPLRRMRHTIASAVLGMIASALPGAFGDFVVVSHLGTLRAARTSRASPRRSRSFSFAGATIELYEIASSSISRTSRADAS